MKHVALLDVSFNLISSISNLWLKWSNSKTGNILRLNGNSNLTDLNWGYVNGTKLSEFPLEISRIAQQIESIDVSGQYLGFGVIPSEIGNFTNLKYLSRTYSTVLFIPDALCRLNKLEHLDLFPLQSSSSKQWIPRLFS